MPTPLFAYQHDVISATDAAAGNKSHVFQQTYFSRFKYLVTLECANQLYYVHSNVVYFCFDEELNFCQCSVLFIAIVMQCIFKPELVFYFAFHSFLVRR